jgi:signal transduction histidine kinase
MPNPADFIALSKRQGVPEGDAYRYEELSRLNSDLLTLQRELARKNADLEREITERNRVETALRQSDARLRFTLEATHVGQWDLDLVTGDVQRTLGHDLIFGYDSLQSEWSYDLFLNRHCHPADRALFDQKFKEALAKGQSWESEYRFIHTDQSVRWMWAKGDVYLRDGDKPLRMAGLIMDITDRKKIEQDHQRLATELNRSNTDLEQFAYVASHDLQEPLRAVAGCVQVLQKRYKGSLDAGADELIGHTVEGVSRMQTLINDLLAYSRIATRGQEFVSSDLAGVVGRALASLQSSVKESAAVVTQDTLPTIKADRGQMTQLFQNLIGNALKYRGTAAPNVHIGVQRHEGEWVFSVRDNGIGIKKEFFDRIFILFQRLHNRTKYTGTGIGLAICKKIVERHGGRIWVESEPGNGSTFFFTIPDQEEKS